MAPANGAPERGDATPSRGLARKRRARGALRALPTGELGRCIGSGARSEIFALDDGRAIKLFHTAKGLAHVGAEFEVTRGVRAAGGPAWRVDEMVRVGGRLGIVGERVAGETYADALRSGRLTLPAMLRGLLGVHAALRGVTTLPAATFRPRRVERLLGPVVAPPRTLEAHGVCHGDLSLDNLMLAVDGRTVVVDWSSAFHGPLFADVAIANRALRGALSRPGSPLRHRLAKPLVVLAHRVAVCRRMGWRLTRFAVAACLLAAVAARGSGAA